MQNFVWHATWAAPRGPFTIDTAREVAEAAAAEYPGEVVHLLTSAGTVMMPAPTPEWEWAGTPLGKSNEACEP